MQKQGPIVVIEVSAGRIQTRFIVKGGRHTLVFGVTPAVGV